MRLRLTTLIQPLIHGIFKLVSRINLNYSEEFLFQRLCNKVFSIWMSYRFRCENGQFRHPINYRAGAKYFQIGKNCSFGKLVVLTAWDKYFSQRFEPEVRIGDNCAFGDYLHLTCINRIIIGNGVLTGRWVTISDNNHGSTDLATLHIPPTKRELINKGPIIIGDNVWIGDKATILANVTIGEGAVIGSNAVITKDIPPYSIAVGNPAKTIKQLI